MIAVLAVYGMIGFCMAGIHLRWHRLHEMHRRAQAAVLLMAFFLWPLPLLSAVLIETSAGWRRFVLRRQRRWGNHELADDLEERFPDDDAR